MVALAPVANPCKLPRRRARRCRRPSSLHSSACSAAANSRGIYHAPILINGGLMRATSSIRRYNLRDTTLGWQSLQFIARVGIDRQQGDRLL